MTERVKRAKKQDAEEENIEEEIMNKEVKDTRPVEFIHSGSTMLNEALSQKAKGGGWARNRILNIVGDGSSGKTILAIQLCYICFKTLMVTKSNIFPPVKKLIIIYNNPEAVMDFPLQSMYGEDFIDAVEWRHDSTVEATGRDYLRRVKALKKGEALIYVVDSWDALDSEEESKAFDEAIMKDEQMEGSYNLGKQMFASKLFFKKCCDEMLGKDATLCIISQVRDRIGVSFGKKKYRAGGKALDFYTHQVCWLRVVKKVPRVVRGRERIWRVEIEGHVERNKTAIPYRKATFGIVFGYGIDDVSSMVDWLFKKGPYILPSIDKPYKDRKSFIQRVYDDNLIAELRDEVDKEVMEVNKGFEVDWKQEF